MKYRMYSIRDRLTGFMTPVVEQTDQVAVRNFHMACDKSRNSQSLMSFVPSDYSLYHIADFDTESGTVTPILPVEFICSGDSFGG